MIRWPSSLRARLTLWYTLLLGFPLVGFAVAGYLVLSRTLDARTNRFIADALTAFSGEVTAERRTGLSPDEAVARTLAEVRFRDLRLAVIDSAGRTQAGPVAGEEAEPHRIGAPAAVAHLDQAVESALLAALRRAAPGTEVSLTVSLQPNAQRVVARSLAVDNRRYLVAGAYSLRDTEELLGRIRAMFLVAIPALVVAAAAGGFLLARRSLAPVASMAEQAARITATSLDQRLPVGGGEELVGLARVVNDLLDRLEQAFAQQRRFVADASHELRTPTAILRTEADVLLAVGHRPESDYRASAAVIQDAARRLTRIVDELFLLARADAGHLVLRREAVYLEDLVHDAVRGVHSMAEARGVGIELGELTEAPLEGDPDLLGRLILNLLDNAIKYSPPGGLVSASMRREPGAVSVSVVDAGPGVAAEARERIFERWFRVDSARSRTEPSGSSGAGLGLPIARRIAEMHGGRLELADSRPGRTEFRLTLPFSA
ncbi:MAG: sensor histidine kinase [Gemmatimonadales bacterium]